VWFDDSGADGLGCDAAALAPDVASVDTLARLQLASLRLGLELGLSNASPELLDLISLVGLCEVLPVRSRSGVEPDRQSEEREQGRSIDDGADPRVPPG
jgi:hypothetical protein